jgi:hypothetical protein
MSIEFSLGQEADASLSKPPRQRKLVDEAVTLVVAVQTVARTERPFVSLRRGSGEQVQRPRIDYLLASISATTGES